MNNKIIIVTFIVLVFSVVYGMVYGFANSEILGVLKPITVFQYSCFLFYALLITKYIHKIQPYKYKILPFVFLLLLASGYEVVWNFLFWFSNYGFFGVNTNVDKIQYTPFQMLNITFLNMTAPVYEVKPINLNVATKVATLIFFTSLYLIFLLRND